MTDAGRPIAMSVCLALGAADLVAMNLLIAPRLVRAQLPAPAQVAAPLPVAPAGLAAAIVAAPPPPPPQPEPATEPAPVEAISATLLFGTAGVRVGDEGRAHLQAFVDGVGDEGTIVVEGHADARGDEETNLHLSRLRAQAVAAELRRLGVPRDRIVVRALGASVPAALGDDPDTLRMNRRVELRREGGEP